MRIFVNELEYHVDTEMTIFEFLESIGRPLFHLEYLTNEYELIDASIELVEIIGQEKVQKAKDIYVSDGIQILTDTIIIKENVKSIISDICNQENFRCFVVPIGQNGPEEYLQGFVIVENFESGYLEYYPKVRVNNTPKLLQALSDDSLKVVALIDPKIAVNETIDQSLKRVGFSDIVELDLGIKIKAIEEVDSFARKAANFIDGNDEQLPFLVTDDVNNTYEISRTKQKKLLSDVIFSFQIEANLYKNYFNKNQNIYMVYITTQEITNANVDLYLSHHVDCVVSVNDLKEIMDCEFFDNSDLKAKLSALIVNTLNDLVFKRNTQDLIFEFNNDRYELKFKKGKKEYSILVMNELPKEELLGISLVIITDESPDLNQRELLYKEKLINDIYKNYLKTPGSEHIKRSK